MSLPKLQYPSYNATLPDSKKEIKYRPFTVKEEKIMLLALESDDDRQVFSGVKDLVTACTFGKIALDKLSTVDAEFLFLQIRNKSLGEGMDVKATCVHCNTSNLIDINLDNVSVEQSVKVDKIIELSPSVKIVMRYPSVEDTILQSSNPFALTAKCIEFIENDGEVTDTADEDFSELVKWVEDLTKEQSLKIDQFFESIPKIVYNDSFVCVKCRQPNTIKLEGLANFFVS